MSSQVLIRIWSYPSCYKVYVCSCNLQSVVTCRNLFSLETVWWESCARLVAAAAACSGLFSVTNLTGELWIKEWFHAMLFHEWTDPGTWSWHFPYMQWTTHSQSWHWNWPCSVLAQQPFWHLPGWKSCALDEPCWIWPWIWIWMGGSPNARCPVWGNH